MSANLLAIISENYFYPNGNKSNKNHRGSDISQILNAIVCEISMWFRFSRIKHEHPVILTHAVCTTSISGSATLKWPFSKAIGS